MKKNHVTFCFNSQIYKMAMLIIVLDFIKLKLNRGKNFKSINIIEMEVTDFIP